MSSIYSKMDALYFGARSKATGLKEKAKTAFRKEDGDTNFISIIIVLAIVLVVAIVFMTLKDEIVGWVTSVWQKFTQKADGSDNNTPIPQVPRS